MGHFLEESRTPISFQVDKEVQASDISYRLLAFVKASPQYV